MRAGNLLRVGVEDRRSILRTDVRPRPPHDPEVYFREAIVTHFSRLSEDNLVMARWIDIY